MLSPMDASSYHDFRSSLRQLCLNAPRPWLVGFSGGKLSQPPAFGIWRQEPVDAIAHQRKLRSEWEGA